MPATSRWRSALAALTILVIGTLAGVALAEVTLRVYASVASTELAWRLRADPYAVLIEPHGEAGYRPRPGRSFTYDNGTTASINSLGYRGPEVATPKPAGTTRILLLGGSTTYGWGVDDEHTVDRYLREALVRRFPGGRFEVVNLAFDGYDSWQLFERLRTDGARLEPDFVIVNTGVNDVRNARFPRLVDRDPRTLLWLTETTRLREERRRGGPTAWTRAKHHLYLARLPGILRQQAGAEPDTLRTPYPDALDYFERNLRRIVALADSADAVLVLSSDPSSLRTKYQPSDTSSRTYWIHDAETTQTYRDSLDARLRGVVAAARAGGLDVVHAPPADIPPAHFLDDTHLAPEGNRRLAEHWAQVLTPMLAQADGATGR